MLTRKLSHLTFIRPKTRKFLPQSSGAKLLATGFHYSKTYYHITLYQNIQQYINDLMISSPYNNIWRCCLMLIKLLKGFFNIFFDGTEAVKLNLIPVLTKDEIRRVEN
ncbi:hypothetical protein Psch_02428 [Pelotomaculum schinkii]|uniref:Uncharacterized protein n=1 Tax=Pelotomaculum schinkii TaxID=78350 RepID=A0A4Y7R9A7_9FIRM|nr:hypothetical protein Psch_02428 [Pelotomaculum schinkii]